MSEGRRWWNSFAAMTTSTGRVVTAGWMVKEEWGGGGGIFYGKPPQWKKDAEEFNVLRWTRLECLGECVGVSEKRVETKSSSLKKLLLFLHTCGRKREGEGSVKLCSDCFGIGATFQI
uniref:(northern house mosquito) hypothetical protein n=1 Tax=Culex pipiens TaxID=7175 RepID=A0A8D8BXH9_CULPI